MPSPTLDSRSADDFFQQALALAAAYCPGWTSYWPHHPPTAADIGQDVGLVLLQLFSQLARYTADIENEMPVQRRLAFYQFLNLQLRPPLPAVTPLQFVLKAARPPRQVPRGTAVVVPQAQALRFQTDDDLLVVPARMSAAMALIPTQDAFIEALPVFGSGAAVPLFVTQGEAAARDGAAQRPLGHWFLIGDPSLFKPDDSLQDITIDLVGRQLYPQYFGQWADGALAPLAAHLIPTEDALGLRIVLAQAPAAGPRTVGELQAQLCAADGLPAQALDGVPPQDPQVAQDYWLLVKPSPQVKVLAALEQQLPVITGLQCTFRGKRILPQQGASNTLLLDLPNGAYPFGQTPQQDDAFYIRSDPVFTKTGARLELSFQLVDVEFDYPVALAWQFWDGVQWQSMNQTPDQLGRYQFEDTTHSLQYNNPDGATFISFLCPPMSATTVAGIKGYWLRATIASGSYGQPGGFQAEGVDLTIGQLPDEILLPPQKARLSRFLNDVAGVNFSYRFDASQYAPPFIRSLHLTYSYSARPGSFWSYNAFKLSRFLFSPFKPLDDVFATFCFAFAPGDFGRFTVGGKLTLYFHLAEETVAPVAVLSWQWHDGQVWQPLAVDDGSHGLSRCGVVSFTVPAAMLASTVFSQTAYWFRVSAPRITGTVRVYGIYPNTVPGRNLTTVLDEVLGASNAQPDQTFLLKSTPVAAGLDLQVIEPAGLEPAPSQRAQQFAAMAAAGASATAGRGAAGARTMLERSVAALASSPPRLAARAGAAAMAVGTTADEAQAGHGLASHELVGGSDADLDADLDGTRPASDDTVYRRWRQVESFAFSGPSDRVYTLDYQSGRVTFGNGRNGLIPPAGHNNIVAARYDATQGLAGNIPAWQLTLLRTGMADLEQVTNPAAALGGVGGDTVADLDGFGPRLAKAAGRAVQLADLGTLAAAADQRVAKARAFEVPAPAGTVTVDAAAATGPRIVIAVVALAADPRPVTSPALRQRVADGVKRRCLAPLASRIEVLPPDFVAVDISVQVAIDAAQDQVLAVQQALATALAGFLQPVFGGLLGAGWDFGETVTASAVSQFLQRQIGVLAVLAISLNGVQGGKLALAAGQLPVAGVMAVLAYAHGGSAGEARSVV